MRKNFFKQELEDFVDEANEALKIELNKDDFEGLLKILSVLNTINEKQYTYDYMFDPLREVVDLLKQYNYDFKDSVLAQVSCDVHKS